VPRASVPPTPSGRPRPARPARTEIVLAAGPLAPAAIPARPKGAGGPAVLAVPLAPGPDGPVPGPGAAALAAAYDSLERRIAELAEKEELGRIRPDLDGHEIMALLGVSGGRVVGDAYKHLLALRMEHGPLPHERAVEELLAWARARGLELPPG